MEELSVDYVDDNIHCKYTNQTFRLTSINLMKQNELRAGSVLMELTKLWLLLLVSIATASPVFVTA